MLRLFVKDREDGDPKEVQMGPTRYYTQAYALYDTIKAAMGGFPAFAWDEHLRPSPFDRVSGHTTIHEASCRLENIPRLLTNRSNQIEIDH